MAELCFDKYVAYIDDIEDNVNGYSDANKDKNCSFFDGKSPERTRMDIINGVSPYDGCCFSSSERKKVINVKDLTDLDSYIKKLKNDYKRIFDEKLRRILDTITNSRTLEIFRKKMSITVFKEETPKIIFGNVSLFLESLL